MINREAIRELAEYQSKVGCAISFYYQPSTPKDQSHREEAILVKELVRNALRDAEKESRNDCARQNLERILGMADNLHGNGGRAKAVFADASTGLWREFDLPTRISGTQISINSRFHLKPLAPVLDFPPRVACCLIDRSKARLFEYNNGEVREIVDFFNKLPRENDGFAGVDAGHSERHVAEVAKRHYKNVIDLLVTMYERDGFDAVVFGCREENWHEIELVLHPYLQQKMLGHFRIDTPAASPDAVVEGVERLLRERGTERKQVLIREVIGEAARDANGAVGLRRVLRALEQGEVQTLLIGDRFAAPGSECMNCGHLELNGDAKCSLCQQETRKHDDIADAIIGFCIRNGIEVLYVVGDEEIERAGHIAALLRFRADQNTPMKLAS